MDSRTGKESFAVSSAPGHKPHVTSIFDFSAEALGQLRLWLEQNPPAIGISNILGFSQFTAQSAASIVTNETSASATYTDLATVGPSLTMLSDGKYLILQGCLSNGNGTDYAFMSYSVNGAAAVDATRNGCQAATQASVVRASTQTLANGGDNSIVAKYRSSNAATTCGWADRWLLALRYANK